MDGEFNPNGMANVFQCKADKKVQGGMAGNA